MRRAAVLIGVSRSGDLPTLHAVVPGIRHMAGWAEGQGFVDVTELTDESDAVSVRQVQDAIKRIVGAPGGLDQLLVYFAGHGVNIGKSEFWLLSDAPEYASEVVDVAKSATFAESCGIAHVVVVSDACRTAAAGLRMQSVSGVPIFPNDEFGPANGFVDTFYACALGSPAYEVPDPHAAARRYLAVYTETLVDALNGEAERALEWEGPTALVRPWPLRDHLEDEVGRRLARLVPDSDLVQVPGARITSRPTAWLARFRDLAPPAPTRGLGGDARPGSLPAVTRAAVHEHLTQRPDGPADALRSAAGRGVRGAGALLAATERLIAPTDTGPILGSADRQIWGGGLSRVAGGGVSPIRGNAEIRVHGDQLAQVAVADDGRAARFQDGTASVLLVPGTGAAGVLAELGTGTSVLLPVFDRHLTDVTVESGEVVAIVCEPLDRPVDLPRRALRALVIASSRVGGFSVDDDDVASFAEAASGRGGVDPVLAAFAGYTATDPSLQRALGFLAYRMVEEFGRTLIDLEATRGRQAASLLGPRLPVLFPFPLLAEGWPLIPGEGLVSELRAHLAPSIWTQFTPRGAEIVRRALRLR